MRSSSKRKASATSRLEVYHELLDGSLGRSVGAVNAVKDWPCSKATFGPSANTAEVLVAMAVARRQRAERRHKHSAHVG
jgi:hypothetical protein